MIFDVIEIMEIVSSCFKRKIIPVFPAQFSEAVFTAEGIG